MAFDLKTYIRQKQKDQDSGHQAEATPSTPSVGGGGASGGFDLRSYIKRRDISSGKLQREDEDFNAWLGDLDGVSKRISGDYAKRKGRYQPTAEFKAYQSKTDQELADLLTRGERALDYYKTWGADYDKAYGEGKSREILKGLDQGLTYLAKTRRALRDEDEYWGQFKDEDGWRQAQPEYWTPEAVQGRIKALEEELEAAKQARNAINPTLPEGVTLADPRSMMGPAWQSYMAATKDRSAAEEKVAALTERLAQEQANKQYVDELGMTELARTDPEAFQRNLAALRQSLGRAEAEGGDKKTANDIRKKIKQAQTAWQKVGYEAYQTREDFEELGQPGEQKGTYGPLFYKMDDTLVYDLINDLGEARRRVGVVNKDGYSYIQDGELSDLYERFLHLEPQEVKTFNAIYKLEGAEAAKAYLDFMTEELNRRQGMATYENMTPVDKAIYWIPAGLDQFSSGAHQLFSKEALPTSPEQFASSMVREEAHEISPILGAAYDAGTSISNMAPSVLASMAVGMINPAAGTVVAGALMGGSAAGNAYNQKVKEGYDPDQAKTYAALVGASEALLQYLIGGVSQLGGVSSEKLLAKIARIDNGFARFALTMGVHGLSEGTEEGLQEILEPAFAAILFGDDYEVDPGDVVYSALMGAIVGDVFALPGEVGAQARDSRTGKAYQAMGGDVDALVAQGLKQTPGSEVYQRALAAQEKLEGGKALSNGDVGRLYRSGMGAVESELYAAAVLADAQETYVRKGSVGQEVVNTILENPAARAQIAQETGVELDGRMSKDRATRAVNEALDMMARGETIRNSDEARVRRLERGIAELDAQQVERGAADLGMQGKSTVTGMYLEGQNAQLYVQGMRELYQAGLDGTAMDDVDSRAVQSLNEHQRRAAYAAGQVDATANSQTLGNMEGGEDLPFYFGSEKGAVDHEQAGVRVRDGGQRVDGAGAQVEVGGVEEGTGGVDTRADRAGPADDGAGALQVGKAVSTYALGITDGVKTDSVRLVTGGETESIRAAKAEAAQRGLELVVFTGGNLHVQVQDGEGNFVTVEARGYIRGDKVYIRGDHSEYTAYQLWRHEEYHDMAATGEVDPEATMRETRRLLGEELTGRLEEAYSRALGGIEGVELWAEIAADAYAGINFFAGTSWEGSMAALGVLVGTQTEAQKVKSQTQEATDRRTGPPQAQKAATERELGGGKFSIERLPDGRSYVKADRLVIFGNDPISWRHQLEDYINGKIRRGENVQLVAADGDILTLTADTAGKVSSPYRGDGTSLSEVEYERKVSAGAHIDELAQVSRSQGKKKPDQGGRHGEFASQGWDYRDAYFQDFDGKYYQVNLSAAIGADGKVVYNIGAMQERSLPTVAGSSAKGGALNGEKTSLSESVPRRDEDVKGKSSQEPGAYVQELRDETQRTSQADLEQEVRAAVQRALQSLVEEYGAMKPGESSAREVQVPRKTGKHDKVSQTVRTILEAKATPEVAVPTIEELTARGEFSYQALSDKTAMERATKAIEHKGWGQSLGDWFQAVKNGVVSKENTAMGWALYNQAVNAGDVTTAVEIIQRMVRHQRNAAQAVQATRILKQLSPEAQLYAAQRSVESLQEEINERYGDEKGPKLVISEELARRLLEAGDQEARDGVLRDIYRDIGRQMPSTFLDKWNAWRYLSMLGNARTHVRNIVGNAGFMPVVAVKDMTATAIERAVYAVSGGKLERSKALVGLGEKGRSMLAAAWGDYAKVQDAAMGGGKYGEFQSANRYIEEGRVVFRSKPGKVLEAARKANSRALDVEDMWFSKPHYAYAMAQYCAAQSITAETVRAGDAKVLEAARAYAIKEAQKATYRDTNALSQMLGGLGRDLRRSKNLVSRGMGVAVEGILPFRKTPANILARGLEYSPMGLVKGLSYDLWQVRKGNMTGAEAIDNISAGLTGTGLMALGVWLAALGLLRGRGPGDDKERELEKLQGHQDYSLELGDMSITLDWLAPEALPLFVGVNLWETAQEQEGEVTMSGALGAVGMVSDPLLEMSCLQSLNDIFDSVGYASGNDMNPLTSALVSAATSYLTQGLPTVFGQAERVFETQRESTYTSKDAFLTGDMQYFLGKVSGKVPFWEFQQVPWVDAWGRTEETGGLGERAFNNLLNPAYVSEIETSPMEEELVRLYEATGENVFPSRARKYFQVDGTRRDLDAEEYVDYATRKGQTARRVVEALVGDRRYGGLEDGEKAEAVKDAYQYAEQTARRTVAKDYVPDSWVVKAQQAEKEYKIPVEVYILLRGQTAGLESIRDKNGEAIPNSKGLQIMEVVYAVPGLGDRQRGYLFEALGAGKSIRHYNKALVQEKLGKMRKKK